MQGDLSRVGVDAFHQLSQGLVTLRVHNRLRSECSSRRSGISTYSAIAIKVSGNRQHIRVFANDGGCRWAGCFSRDISGGDEKHGSGVCKPERGGTEGAVSTTGQETPSRRINANTQTNVKFLGGVRVLVVCEPFESLQKLRDRSRTISPNYLHVQQSQVQRSAPRSPQGAHRPVTILVFETLSCEIDRVVSIHATLQEGMTRHEAAIYYRNGYRRGEPGSRFRVRKLFQRLLEFSRRKPPPICKTFLFDFNCLA